MWNKLHPERMKAAYQRWKENHPEKFKKKQKEASKIWKKNGGRKRYNKKYYSNYEEAKCRYKKWDIVDDIYVIEHKMTDRKLSEMLGRSIRAIQVRRAYLKRREK